MYYVVIIFVIVVIVIHIIYKEGGRERKGRGGEGFERCSMPSNRGMAG